MLPTQAEQINAEVFKLELEEFGMRSYDEEYSRLVEGMLPHKTLSRGNDTAAKHFFTLMEQKYTAQEGLCK